MDAEDFRAARKLVAAKLLLDTFEIPKRPIALSAHQFKKRFGTNQGYSAYKKSVKQERLEWDALYKDDQKNFRKKLKILSAVHLSDDALKQAEQEALELECDIADVLSRWLEKGRDSQ